MSVKSPHMSIMIKAAEKAARSLNRDFGEVERLQVSTKGPGDFVSAADKRAEEIIHSELSYARPDYNFIMEEGGTIDGKDDHYTWIVDPLDGTSNFLHGLPHWAISIGLRYKKEIVAGLVYDPIKDEMFMGEKGAGAFKGRQRLRVSGRNDPMAAMICTGAPRRMKENPQFVKEYNAVLNYAPGIRRFGAASLDICYVAAGRFDAFWERHLKIWDIAAGAIILKEAGGFISEIDSDKADYLETGGIICANEAFFNPLKKIIRDA